MITRRTLLSIGITAPAFAQTAAKLPAPFETPSVNNRPRVVPKPEGAQLSVPKGFQIEEFASGFKVPRFMILGPSNEIIMSDSARDGGVYVLTNYGKERKQIVEKLFQPYGLALSKGYLYVAETTSVKRYKYDAKAMTVGAGEEIISFKDFDKGHWTRTLLFDRKGEKLFVTVGSGSNVDAGESPMRAAVHRYNPDGGGHEIFASGLRNTIGLRWYPGSDVLWGAIQERDLLGDDLVPDYLTHIQQGGFYGWPYAYFGPHEDPRRKGENPDLVKKTITPDLSLGAHVAVIDFTFYTGKQFPAEYQGGAFCAFHGSWNRSKRVGQSVAFVPFQNGKPAGEPREFLKGWMLNPDSPDVWGRPTGTLVLPDGSLLVSDDGGKKVWRISYKG